MREGRAVADKTTVDSIVEVGDRFSVAVEGISNDSIDEGMTIAVVEFMN